MRLGADVEQLDRLAQLLDHSARRVDALRSELTAASVVPLWWGPDASRFRDRWRAGGARDLANVAAQLETAGAAARRQSAAQRFASAANGLGDAADVPSGTLPPGPATARTVTVEVVGGEDIVLGARAEFVVEQLGEHRVRVTEATKISGGVGASGGHGAVVDMGSVTHTEGALGGAAAQFLVGSGTSWVVDESEIDSVLIALVRDGIAGPAARSVADLDRVPGLGIAAGLIGLGSTFERLTYDLPSAESQYMAGGVSMDGAVAGGASSSKNSASGSAGGVGVVGLTRRSTSGDTVVWLESGLAADGAVRTIFGESAGSVAAESRVGIRIDSNGDAVGLEITQGITRDNRVVKRRADVDLTAPGVTDAAGRLVDALRSGRGVEAQLGELVMRAIAHTRVATDVYEAGDPRSYGIEVPFGSVSISSVELTRRP